MDIIVIRIWGVIDGSHREQKTVDIVYSGIVKTMDRSPKNGHTLLKTKFSQTFYIQNPFKDQTSHSIKIIFVEIMRLKIPCRQFIDKLRPLFWG